MITFPEILQCFQVFQTNSKSKATYFHIRRIVFSPCVKMYKPACLTWAYLAFIWKASGIWSNGAISQFHLEDTCWAHSTESSNPLKMQDVLAQILFWSYMFITYSKFRRKKTFQPFGFDMSILLPKSLSFGGILGITNNSIPCPSWKSVWTIFGLLPIFNVSLHTLFVF